jgi:VWFA-related protein
MSLRTFGTTVAVCALALDAVPLRTQEPIRVATRLVQVNVVVHKDGQPVSDLTRADFRVLENGKEQPIDLFEVNTIPAHAIVAEPPAVPTFTNRVLDRSTTVSVILIDNLNTGLVDQIAVRNQAIAFLRELRDNDRVAVYLIDNSDTLRVLHDFTSDTRALVRAVAKVRARTSNEVAAAEDAVAMGETASIADSMLSADLVAWLQGRELERLNDLVRDRIVHFNIALETIASRLATVRGRKNLVWISAAFPIAVATSSGFPSSLKHELNSGLRHLNDSNVAVYPVDARRLIGAFSSRAAAKQQTFTTLSTVRASGVDAMEVMAEETGGRAYFNTNDLRGAMRRAIDDSRVSYMLGYYPINTRWDGGFRQIKVEVKRRGVNVRHRKGYMATPTAVNAQPSRLAALQKAAFDPLEATEIGLSAQLAKPQAGAPPSSVDMTINVDANSIQLTPSGERWTGEVDVIVAEAQRGNPPTLSFSTTLTIDVTGEQRARILANGISLTRTIPFKANVHQLRIVALDVPTGAIGAVHISGDTLRRTIQQ